MTEKYTYGSGVTEVATSAIEARSDHMSDEAKTDLEKLKRDLDGQSLPAYKLVQKVEVVFGEIITPTSVIVDLAVLNSIGSAEKKADYLLNRFNSYFNSMLFPDYLLLAISQKADLKKVFPKIESE